MKSEVREFNQKKQMEEFQAMLAECGLRDLDFMVHFSPGITIVRVKIVSVKD